ncbi:hypothetical protein ACQKHV_12725 [Staphylococcus hominis]|uniref:hypothetical protein n=1 Tax=Staphylococcus hominis TaxID=1290 RepID=UPI003D08DF69
MRHDDKADDTAPPQSKDAKPDDVPPTLPRDDNSDVPQPDAPGDAPAHDHVPKGTAAAVAYWHQRDPDLHPAQIATRIGRSERTVRRHWPPPTDSATPHVNGHHASDLADSWRR